jgi:hypothetical protein
VTAIFWTIPSAYLSPAAAARIALISSIGSIKNATGSLTYAMYFVAAVLAVGAVLIVSRRAGEAGAGKGRRLAGALVLGSQSFLTKQVQLWLRYRLDLRTDDGPKLRRPETLLYVF